VFVFPVIQSDPPKASYQRRGSFALALSVMARTLFALLLRESRVRHGRSRYGYAWALIEPVLIVSIIAMAHAGLFGRRELSFASGIFYALGVVNFQFFRHCSSFVGNAIEANGALLNYPRVHEIDAALARFLLDGATYVLINAALFGFIVVMFGASWPAHPERLLLAYGGLALLEFGIGLNISALQRRYEMSLYLYGMASAPLLLFSCVLFSIESVSTDLQRVLVWNPIMHGIEGFRSGYYPDYARTQVSFGYLYFVGLVLTALGMVQVLLTRRGMR
jgi:capsular polysaccharide transport system permease protein